MDKGVEPPALGVISYPKREARSPTDYANYKISVGMAPSSPSSGRPRTRSQPGHEADGGAPTPSTQISPAGGTIRNLGFGCQSLSERRWPCAVRFQTSSGASACASETLSAMMRRLGAITGARGGCNGSSGTADRRVAASLPIHALKSSGWTSSARDTAAGNNSPAVLAAPCSPCFKILRIFRALSGSAKSKYSSQSLSGGSGRQALHLHALPEKPMEIDPHIECN